MRAWTFVFAALSATVVLAQPMKAVYTVPHELDALLKHGHIQGATCSKEAIFLSHAGGIFKIDWKTGHVLKSCEAQSHLGDIAFAYGRIYGVYGLRNPPKGKSPCMIGVWDKDLKPLREVYYDYPDARGFDGAVVIGETLYAGVDHYGKGWAHPPHKDCTVARFSVPDLKPLGPRDVVFDYHILFGVQTLASDGKDLLFGNYGGETADVNPNWYNFSRVTTDFKLIDSGRFHANEGFGLVPRTVSGRDKPVFFNVNALGGNMQGWRKDPTNNPPRIRIDFYEYDRSTGKFTDITDRTEEAAKPFPSGQFTYAYDRPDTTPIVFSAESRAENAVAEDYCLWLDIHYADGSATWGMGDARADCRSGTHGWERTTGVFVPEKPVTRIEFSLLFRKGTEGKVEFRNPRVERREPKPGEGPLMASSDFPRTRTDGELSRGPETVGAGDYAVWTADSMDKVTPLTYPGRDVLAKPPSIALELARNERESAQICLTCGARRELKGVELELSPLKNAAGVELKGGWKWERVGYVPRMKGYARHPLQPNGAEKWVPDPLLPAAKFRVRPGSTQGAWLTVYAAPDAAPGDYAGTVRIRTADDVKTVPVRIGVTRRALPKTFSTWNSFSVMDGFTRKLYPNRFREMKRATWDMMLDHRLSPDDISRFNPPEIDDLLYARERGMNLFNILNIVPPPKDPNTPIVYTTSTDVLFSDWFYPSFRDRIVPYVAELRKHGLDRMAYVYGFDEQEKQFYPAIDLFWKNLRRDIPGIPLMSTSRAYRDISDGVKDLPPSARSGDWFCPVTSDWNAKLSEELRKEGKKVWWYTCCAPGHPYANFASLEFPTIEGRLIGWMTHLYRADGYLFWVVNFWHRANNAPLDESDTYLEWDSTIDTHEHGDGVLMYPGKEHVLASIRLANVRDGVEDGELLKMLAAEDPRRADAACRTLIRDLKHFSRDPVLLRTVRKDLLK